MVSIGESVLFLQNLMGTYDMVAKILKISGYIMIIISIEEFPFLHSEQNNSAQNEFVVT